MFILAHLKFVLSHKSVVTVKLSKKSHLKVIVEAKNPVNCLGHFLFYVRLMEVILAL